MRLHERGLVYRGSYLVNWSPSMQTAVSDLEARISAWDSKWRPPRWTTVLWVLLLLSSIRWQHAGGCRPLVLHPGRVMLHAVIVC